MIADFERLRKLIEQDHADRVLQTIGAQIQAYPDQRIMFSTISRTYKELQDKKIMGMLDSGEEMRLQTGVTVSLLGLIDQLEQAATSSAPADTATPTAAQPTQTAAAKKVFISYNHNDIAIANALKDKLTAKNVDVYIDSERMQGGEDIKDFIEKCVRDTEVTISLVSKNSLLSAWVAMESINTFYHEKTDTKKKFLACFITDDFFKRTFTDEALDHIEANIKEIQTLITARMEKNRSIRDLQNELTRNTELRNGMDEIVRRLRESLCIDIRDANFENNFPKVLSAIQS